MQGSSSVVNTLVSLLTSELSAMDIYFLQSRMLKDWGLSKLSDRFAHEHEDEKNHADMLIERILFLEGIPDIRSREACEVGTNVKEMLEHNLAHELMIAKNLKSAIKLCENEMDFETRSILTILLKDTEEDHINWLETQMRLIDSIGLENYCQSQVAD